MTAAPQPRTTNGSNGLAVGGFVTGLLSTLVGWLFTPIGIVLGILGIVLSVRSRKQTPGSGLATAGLVLGVIGTALCVVLLIVGIAIVNN